MADAAKPTPEQRRARKAERRAKQRATNLLRAEKMRKARLADPSAPAPASDALPNVNIGCSGWFYWDWKGKFYPSQMPTKEWFGHYAEHFTTVELNAPFYGWPTVNAIKGWLRQAGELPFIYTVKVSELITHIRRFEDVQDLIRDFGYIADLLGERMGCFLHQFPASFPYTPERLDRIVSQLDHRRRNVIEFRHESWWNEAVYAAFREHGTIFCSTSGPNLPDAIIRTADEIYVRFHGPERWYRYDYSDAELSDWARRIRESGARRVWAYFNNDYNAYAIKNAQALRKMLSDQP
ncbi:MAG: DUF72 domain-containing protein [Asticcacaulis sp.]|uniref:DUF72 domain-containing protein n=1 Tax=Asticcacaulis sp. TaxID=1872648 RepID=UPI003F7B91E9